MTTVKARSYGVDVAAYQSTSVGYANAKFAFVKVTEGTGYVNPKAQAQIASAKSHGLLPMAYFFATFGANQASAKAQARFACQTAKRLGLPEHSYIAVDWESGDGNNISSGKSVSALAILKAMDVIKANGFKPLLYSGASLLKNNIDASAVIKKYGTCLWVASYAKSGRIDVPSFGYFPSMDGIAIWQFTDDWKGLSVDGNISLVELSNSQSREKSASEKSLHVYCKWNVPRVFVVTNLKGCNVYDNADLKHKVASFKLDSGHRVYEEKCGALRVGKGLWVDGRAGYTKSNPLAFYDYKSGRIIVMQNGTHALYDAKPNAAKAYAIKKGTVLHVAGRKDRFFELADKYKGKAVYVTAGIDGQRSYVVL